MELLAESGQRGSVRGCGGEVGEFMGIVVVIVEFRPTLP